MRNNFLLLVFAATLFLSNSALAENNTHFTSCYANNIQISCTTPLDLGVPYTAVAVFVELENVYGCTMISAVKSIFDMTQNMDSYFCPSGSFQGRLLQVFSDHANNHAYLITMY
jgi:hypothetical protein